MITTVCLNPSFDKTASVDTLKAGEVNRLLDMRVDMGGKGLNVAAVAHRLGLEAQCLGIMGEDGAAAMNDLIRREGIGACFLTIPGTVRTNLKVSAKDTSCITEFNEPGTLVSKQNFMLFCQMAKEKSQASDYMVLTGSLPPGCGIDAYKKLMEQTPDVPCVLDTLGDALILGLESHPFLIKPNLIELETTLKRPLKTLREIQNAALDLILKGARNVIVSMGRSGALMTDGASTFYAPALKVTALSTVGAGDAMVAGVLYGLETLGDMRGAFRCGMAAAAASVMTPGTQLTHVDDFEQLLPQVKLQGV